MIRPIVVTILPLWITLATLMSGCDDRVAKVSREAADRQAEQNRAMARLQQHVADGTRSLVTADAEARRDFVAVHQGLQSERQVLDQAWNTLEAERLAVAQDRRTESLLAQVIPVLGWVVLLAVLLTFLRQVLQRSTPTDPVDAELNQLLIQELLESPSIRPERERLPLDSPPPSRLPVDPP